MRHSQIPPPVQGDHEDVRWALSTATSLLASGEHDEALRWVRRAVAAAVASDDDTRAIELGRFAAELEERLAGAMTQRGDDDLDQPTYAEHCRPDDATSRPPGPAASSGQSTPRIRDTSPAMPPFIDEEVTVVPFTMKAAGLEAVDVLRARRLAGKTLKVEEIPSFRRPSSDAPPTEAPPAERGSANPTERPVSPDDDDEVESRHTHVSRSFDDRLFDDEPTVASRPRIDAGAASSSTMPALTRWRVALLATADDDQPRVLYLGPGVEPPTGAAVAFLVPCSDEDARAVAALLRPGSR